MCLFLKSIFYRFVDVIFRSRKFFGVLKILKDVSKSAIMICNVLIKGCDVFANLLQTNQIGKLPYLRISKKHYIFLIFSAMSILGTQSLLLQQIKYLQYPDRVLRKHNDG